MMGSEPLSKIVLYLLLAVYAAAETPCLKLKGNLKERLKEFDPSPKRYITHKSVNYPLVLGVSERLSHRLTTEVFKIFLNEVLGYPDVKVQLMNRTNNTDDVIRQFFNDFNNENSILKPMVDMETWVPLSDNALHEPYFSSKVVECGSIGPPVRFGWFAPTDLLKKVLNRTIIVYNQFKDPIQTSVFSLLDEDILSLQIRYSFEPPWCHREDCATLIASEFNATAFVRDDITQEHLYVRVFWVDDFMSVVSNLLTKYENRNDVKRNHKVPLIIGHTLELLPFNRRNFTHVIFPPCEHYGSIADFPSAGCNYEGQRIVKLVWDGILGAAESVHDAITKIQFSASDYEELTNLYFSKAVQQKPSESDRVFNAACQWMVNNKNVVLSWSPHDEVELHIIGIFPLSRPVFSPAGIYIAAQMAIEEVNRADILSNYKLKLLLEDGECRADVVMRTFISYIVTQFRKIAGILGPACSETVEPLAGVATHFDTVVISYSAEGSSFSDRTKYPYFFRTIGENRQYQYVYQEMFKYCNWKRVATLSEDGTKYTEYVSQTQDLLIKDGVSFIANRKFSQNWMSEPGKMKEYLEEFKAKEARIIIADMNEAAAKVLMCEAYHMNMTAKNGFVWFLPSWLTPFWLDQEQNLVHNVTSNNRNLYCTSRQMQEAIDGHLSFSHAFFAPDNDTIHTNKTVKQWKEEYNKKLRNTKPSDYAGYAYDAVWVYAKALDALIKENQTFISNLHSRNVTEKYVNYIQNSNFSGVSGQIEFKDGPSRNSTQVNIYQWQSFSEKEPGKNHGTRVLVGTYDPSATGTKRFVLNNHLIWKTGGIPWDGTQEKTCIVDGLAKLLKAECQTALIVANIVGIGFILLVVTVAFLVIKHRYDKKVQLTQKYMKSLGIDLLAVSGMNTLDTWEIPKDRVVINRALGQGAFGTVYGGEAYFGDSWVGVAVKTLKVGSTSEEKLDFLSEAEVMKRFDHKNIVQLLGVCTKNEPVFTIMEFMLYGDLKTFLLARRHLVKDGLDDNQEFSSLKLTNMAMDIARALSYLAELKYVHRDVASRNCLVNNHLTVKLGDFGMTRPMLDNDYYRFNRKGMLPVRWMAPESLIFGLFTPASDVWSYGVVLYEIITFGNFPFQGYTNFEVLEYVKKGNTLTIPNGVKANLETLIRSCWHKEYQKRPPAAEILEFLASNPRIISPCLDVPLSSVPPMEDNTFGIKLPEGKTRKFSMTLRQRVTNSPSNEQRGWTDFSEPLLNNRATCSNSIAEDPVTEHDENFSL